MNEKFIPVSKWDQHFKYPTVQALRQLIFYDRKDFRKKVLKYIGKRQYIDVEAFNNWVKGGDEND